MPPPDAAMMLRCCLLSLLLTPLSLRRLLMHVFFAMFVTLPAAAARCFALSDAADYADAAFDALTLYAMLSLMLFICFPLTSSIFMPLRQLPQLR